MREEDLDDANSRILNSFDATNPTSVSAVSDIITNAVMSAARWLAIDDEAEITEIQCDYQDVKHREIRFDGKYFSFNNLIQFAVSEAEASTDKSKTLFDMCDSDMDRLFDLGRNVAESGVHEAYLNTLLKTGKKSVNNKAHHPTTKSPLRNEASSKVNNTSYNKSSSGYRAMPKAVSELDAELNLSPFIGIHVDVNAKLENGKHVLEKVSVPMKAMKSKEIGNGGKKYVGNNYCQENRAKRGASPPRRRRSASGSSVLADIRDDLSQHSVNTTRSRLSARSPSPTSFRYEDDEPRRWSRAVEYSRHGSPGRLSAKKENIQVFSRLFHHLYFTF